ncbi:MAG: hypothetical protein ABR543_03985 [Gemmatimonadaceae bacterium]
MRRASLLVLAVLTAACQAKDDAPPDTTVANTGAAGVSSAGERDSSSVARSEDSTMPPGKSGRSAVPTPSEIRGTVAVTGSDPGTMVTLRTTSGSPVLTLTGPQAALISRVSGAEIWVRGTREDARRFQVSAFGVRSVDGVPAADGVLMKHGDSYMLQTSDGKHLTIARLPAALTDKVGARIWLSGQLDRDPNGFGVIEER